MTIALRTQQVIAHESGVVNTADPLGGSYFVEKLTNDIEAEALEYFRKIDAMGGMVAAIERGFPQREIQEAAFQFQRAVERKEKIIVGVNEYVMEEKPIPILYIDETVAEAADRRAVAAPQGDAATTRGWQRRLEDLKDGRARHRQPDVPDPRGARAPTPPSARCATPCARSGASTKSRRSSRPWPTPAKDPRPRSPSPASTATTAGPRSWRARCATPAWRSIYTGLRQSPEQIVAAAAQEDVDAIGLSILSGAHLLICQRVLELLRRRECSRSRCSSAASSPPRTSPTSSLGVADVFLPGASTEDVVGDPQSMATRSEGV